ncbi:MAG: hypothetical protein JO057_30690 [Chloroflexi bacterium]|nr:hypothetical protein [Chloroflexota bacterium]
MVRRAFMRVNGSPQPFSPMSHARRHALVRRSQSTVMCPYCAVGCGQLAYVNHGELIDIEGDPRSPINAGRLATIDVGSRPVD